LPLDGAWKYTHALGLTALNTGAASVNLCHPNSEIAQQLQGLLGLRARLAGADRRAVADDIRLDARLLLHLAEQLQGLLGLRARLAGADRRTV
jgi:hypothetical protein